jgi:hypothetical protein
MEGAPAPVDSQTQLPGDNESPDTAIDADGR